MVVVKLPSLLAEQAGGQRAFEVEAATVGDALRALPVADLLLDERGDLRQLVNVYVDGEDARRGDGLETPLVGAEEVRVIAAIAGGGRQTTPSKSSFVGDRLAEWGYVPHVVSAVFGSEDGAGIERAIDDFCKRRLGARVAVHEFFYASVGSVHGVRLTDGRRVVVKAKGPRSHVPYIVAAQGVQRHLAAQGFPCPEPLMRPAPLAAGVAVVESCLGVGEKGDPHEPPLRRAMAATLASVVALCRPLDHLKRAIGGCRPVGRGLWPTPHDARFDFERTAQGAEWIDALAVRAKGQLHGSRVLGHCDWRAENMRFLGDEVVAVYDWDSVCCVSEPQLVGSAAHYFTSDSTVEGRRQLPSLDEALAFIDDYEAARGIEFDADERQVARAALVYAMAYVARCEHSDALMDFGRRAPRKNVRTIPQGSARAFLARHAQDLLVARPSSGP